MVAEELAKAGRSTLPARWGDAEEAGMDPEALDAGAARLRRQVDEGRLPGFLSCVVKAGKLLHYEEYGYADVVAKLPMRADTLIRLYSQTKPILVVGFLRLLERGAVSLDHPLAKYVPSFAKMNVAIEDGKTCKASRQILLRDLLAHTSGVGFGPGFGYEAENDYERPYTGLCGRVDRGEISSLAEWVEQLSKLPLRFQPGQDWGYGYSSDLLGRVVEVASKRPLDEYLKAEVIDPLGMTDTAFAVPASKAKRLAALYRREPCDGSGRYVQLQTLDVGGSGLARHPAPKHARKAAPKREPAKWTYTPPSASVFLEGNGSSKITQGGGCVCSVAGGLVSTLRDYLRFGRMLLNYGEYNGVRIISQESVKLLARDWLNDYTTEKREQPILVWGKPGIGFSPLGQVGFEDPGCKSRNVVDSKLEAVCWGGAGGSGYMLNWPHQTLVLTYTGVGFDTATQKTMWRATYGAISRGGAKRLPVPVPTVDATTVFATKKRGAEETPETPNSKRPRIAIRRGRAKPMSTSSDSPTVAKSPAEHDVETPEKQKSRSRQVVSPAHK